MDKISTVLTEKWAIMPENAGCVLNTVVQALNAGNIDAVNTFLDGNKIKAFALDPQEQKPYIPRRWELDDENLPSTSVAVLELEGTLYSWETTRLINLLDIVEQNDRIRGVVLWINGPGGMISGVDLAAKRIAEFTKPTATFIAGTMASAHFWIGTASQKLYAASPICEIGSVGVMMSYMGMKKYFKDMGIDKRDIYPDTADLKNFEYRQLEEKGDDKPLKEKLARLHRFFSDTVAKNLGIQYDPDAPLFRGAMFTADEALENGYIDSYGTVADSVLWVLAQSEAKRAEGLFNI